MFFLSQKSKKRSVIVLVVIFGCISVFGSTLFRPTTTYAQFVDVNQGVRNVTDEIGSALLSAGLGAVINGASYFMRKVAYDTAKYIASGSNGQKPLAFQEGFGEYLANTALDSAGSAIEQLGEPFGLNLCKPPDIRLQIGLQVNINKIYENEFGGADGEGGPQPRCSWNDFTENWKNAPETMFSDQALLERFNVSLKTSQGDLGAALDIFGKVDNIIAQKKLANQLDRLEGQGFKPVTDIISGDIRTPAQVIKKETDSITGGKQAELSAGQIAGIYGAGAAQILPMALSVFANTLVNSLLQNVLEKGLLPGRNGGSSVTDFYASTLNSNRQIADAAFSYLIAGIPQRPLTTYDVVTEYSTCSSNPGLNNCVMDSGLAQAVNRARTEAPLTIGEALRQGLLHANWPLVSLDREADNTNLQYCYSSAYCISNIQKLRKARILPLGFEIAARKSDPDQPWTLGEVIGDGKTTGFYDCDPSGRPSPQHKFCKLIDPNWIIKAPEARCEVRVNGPELLTQTAAVRREECVDFSTCLATDADGQCIGFGYCTKEENTWKMPGSSCREQFNTCKTYKGSNGAIASYLSRTIDIASCTLNSVGCLAYSMEKTGDQWKQTGTVDPVLTFEGRTQAIHFNARASTLQCPTINGSSPEGCSLFVDPTTINQATGTNEQVYLKKAPEYLGCYDVNPETPRTIEWPKTQAELTKLGLQKSAQCAQFATACIPEEVGCQEYRPNGGGTSVTGVIGENSCPTQCVGYDTFKQEESNFESAKFPLHFIASNARTCSSQHVGCDEFTNLGAGGAGGESLEYYSKLKHCERPSGQNGKTFYSWEGSDSQGYVLKRHVLLQLNDSDVNYIASLNLGSEIQGEFVAGSPAYVDDTKDALEQSYNQCNQTSYNVLINNPYDPNRADSDCRAFYDSSGGVYYRILRTTVTVSNACTPLRKTNVELIGDSSITTDATCTQKGGLWEGGTCKRCAGGGKYELTSIPSGTAGDGTNETTTVGSCVYQSIKAEAISCPVTANGCRSYIGNTGNNIYEVALFGFEPGDNSVDALNNAEAGWSGNVSVEAESLQVGLHSLRVNGLNTAYTFETGKIQKSGWYELRFWARGNVAFGISSGFEQNGQTVGNTFTFDPLTNSELRAPLGPEWQEYRVGPVQFTGDATQPIQLFFRAAQLSVAQFYFLDNVSLVQIGGRDGEHEFLIKNSWRTPEGYDAPLSCFSSVPGEQKARAESGLPGQYLGCRAYTQVDNNQTVSLTGFDRLCRAEAVGCRAVVDTQNTFEGERPEEKQAYGVVCRKPGGVTTEPTLCRVVLEEGLEEDAAYSCTVQRGDQECRIKTPVVLGNTLSLVASDQCISDGTSCTGTKDKLFIDASTIVVREDSDAVYLADQKIYRCAEQQLGCMKVAQEQQNVVGGGAGSYTYRETIVKNDPRKYNEVLCSADEIGCAEFKHNNTLVYFKDPKLTGNSLCVYKQNVTLGNTTYSGWFMDGVGTCSGGSQNGQFCKANNDCGQGSTCSNIGVTACYSNYQESQNSFGLWSQGSPGYQGFVGVCDSTSNGCTELIDRAAVSEEYPDGQPYYAIMNDRLTQNVGQCEGKVSQKEGCVLFDMTENPEKKYNTIATYQASEDTEPRNTAVVPVESNPKDANLILKVERDRQCNEWLACKSSTKIWDEEGKPRILCEQYAACNKFENGAAGNCATDGWVNTSADNTRLTEEKYIRRPTSWSSPEYSGYSLFGAYNPSNYVYLLFPTGDADDTLDDTIYLGYEMSASFFTQAGGFERQGCRQIDANLEYVKKNGDACGFDGGGRCYAQKCLYPIGGSFTFTPTGSADENIAKMLNELQPGICKSYPEADSPFPINVAVEKSYIEDHKLDDGKIRVDISERKQKYDQAHVCQFGEKNPDGTPKKDCSCEYIKTEYKNGVVDYWPLGSEVPLGICSGDSDKEGMSCSADSQCGPTGVGKCNLLQKKGTSLGLKGLCLEYDYSRPIGPLNNTKLFESYQCMTWLPIQISASAVDLDNLSENAGYNPSIDAGPGGEVYCTESTSRGVGYYDTSLDGIVVDSLGEFGGTIGRTSAALNPGSIPPPTENEGSFPKFNELILYPKSDNKVTYSYNDFVIPDFDQIPVFDSERTTNYGKEGGLRIYKNYDAQGSNEYATLVRLSGESAEDKVKMMRTFQAFAWKNIGTSARVLRLDVRGEEGCADNIGFGHSSGSCDPDEHNHRIFYDQKSQQDSSKIVYGFAPLTNLSSAGSDDTGVLMHPPRLFGGTTIGAEDYFMNPRFGYYADKAGTAAFSPEFRAGTDNKFIYNDYAVESKLNIADLKSVHFVPISFPDGSEGYNPALLTTDVHIDFVALHENRVEGGSAKVAAYSNSADPQYYIDIQDSNEKMNRVSYLLERDESSSVECNGLLSYCDYNPTTMGASGSRLTAYEGLGAVEKERTEIQYRYVTLIFSPVPSEPFASLVAGSSVQAPNNATTDPFQTACTRTTGRRNWLAIGMDFNKDGEFLGYISRWCMNTENSGGEGNGIRFATIANLQDRCLEFSAVVDNSSSLGSTNKAWTDRVWNGRAYGPPVFFSALRNQEVQPFGSLQGQTLQTISENPTSNTPMFGFPDYNWGVPYQCYGGDGFGTPLIGKKMFSDYLRCVAPSAESSQVARIISGNFDSGAKELHKLFMKYYKIKTIEDVANPILNPEQDVSNNPAIVDNTITTRPPRIFAINPVTCNDANSNCTAAGADAFTVNSRNYTIDEDKDNNGIDPIIGEGGSYEVKLQFFAYADDNRMPIKRVGINWDNGEIELKQIGLYQNRKPFCAAGDNTASLGDIGRCSGTQITCKRDADCILVGGTCDKQATNPLKFGDAKRACTEHYFEFEYVYNCSTNDQNLKPVSTLQTSNPEIYTELIGRGISNVCIFQPGVQILDNWGWCNASDANRNPISGGLYNDVSGRCDSENIAFTYYKGKIIVVP